jgi:hypothetical protein
MKSECKLHNGTDFNGYSWTDTSSQTIRIANLFDKKDSENCQILTPLSIFKFNQIKNPTESSKISSLCDTKSNS